MYNLPKTRWVRKKNSLHMYLLILFCFCFASVFFLQYNIRVTSTKNPLTAAWEGKHLFLSWHSPQRTFVVAAGASSLAQRMPADRWITKQMLAEYGSNIVFHLNGWMQNNSALLLHCYCYSYSYVWTFDWKYVILTKPKATDAKVWLKKIKSLLYTATAFVWWCTCDAR